MRTKAKYKWACLPTIVIPFILLFSANAFAQLGCADIGGIDDGSGNCTLSVLYDCTGDTVINIPGDLIIAVGGTIFCDGESAGANGHNLTLTVDGSLTNDGFISANGITGTAGGSGAAGSPGGNGGAIVINVSGDMNDNLHIHTAGGAGGAGGSGTGIGAGGSGAVGGAGGSITITVLGAYTQSDTGHMEASGGAGGPGGAGGLGANGGPGNVGGIGGAIDIFSCATTIDGEIVDASGGAGGAGGSGGADVGAGGGDGGNGANGATGGSIVLESGTDLRIGDATVVVQTAVTAAGGAGGSGGTGGGSGAGQGAGGNGGNGGDGGTITRNHCLDFNLLIEEGAITAAPEGGGGAGGGGNPAGATGTSGAAGTITDLADAPCCPCQVVITKQVALDDDCDGVADGAFTDSVTQDDNQCVVYQICVQNTASDGANVPQDLLDVLVNDAHLGITNADFGDIPAGQTVCRTIPADAPATACQADPDSCVCTEVQGMNTAAVGNAICSATGVNACLEPGSDCDDTANVACLGCSIDIQKTVALDEGCDGIPDGPFGDSVTQDVGECVIYRICVANTGDQDLDASGVTVSDSHLGILNLNFGLIPVGAPAVCQDIPVETPAGACPGPTTDPADDVCVCEDVEGVNTAIVSGAVCTETGSNACDSAESNCDDTAEVTCLTCEVDILKTVALDEGCDGTPDSAFVDSITVGTGDCVIYQICVTNNGEQTLNATGVKVGDAWLGIVDADFGTITPGQTICQFVPTDIPAANCPGGTCVCETVEGVNTAIVTAAVCQDTGANACDFVTSDCDDTAEVVCEGEGCLTKTPGYWGNHPQVTKLFLPVTSCGIALDTFPEAVQDLCKETKKVDFLPQQLQLIRQCAAAKINLSATGFFNGDCDATVPFPNGGIEDRINYCCDVLCPTCSSDKGEISACVEDVNYFNNFNSLGLDQTELCPNEILGTAPPCSAKPAKCQAAAKDGVVNEHCF